MAKCAQARRRRAPALPAPSSHLRQGRRIGVTFGFSACTRVHLVFIKMKRVDSKSEKRRPSKTYFPTSLFSPRQGARHCRVSPRLARAHVVDHHVHDAAVDVAERVDSIALAVPNCDRARMRQLTLADSACEICRSDRGCNARATELWQARIAHQCCIDRSG